MKKLFLLMAAGIMAAPVFAQQIQKSPVFLKGAKMDAAQVVNDQELPIKPNRNLHDAANKTTANDPFWYSYGDLLYETNVSKLYYNVVYQDSNLVYTTSSGSNNVFMHGMGMSFDPSDSAYNYDVTSVGVTQNYDYLNTAWKIDTASTYTIDSIAFLSKYYRSNNVDDTMIIQIAKVPTGSAPTVTGLFDLTFTVSQQSFLSGWYDSSTNLLSSLIPSSNITTEKIVLDVLFYGDTVTNGFSARTLAHKLPTPITFGPKEKVICYVTFKSAINYPLGTSTDNANYLRLYSYDFRGTDADPIQNKRSYQAGLVATSQIKYSDPTDADTTNDGFTFDGRNILIPNIAYAADGLMTDMSFHVSCPNCKPVIDNVHNVNNNIAEVNAYPNPATDNVNVVYTLKEAANVNIIVANTVGQVVTTQHVGKVNANQTAKATFNTSNLPNGVYFITVEADGARSTKRFVVAK